MNERKKEFQINLTRDNIDILAHSIGQALGKLKQEFPKNSRLFANVEISFENLR